MLFIDSSDTERGPNDVMLMRIANDQILKWLYMHPPCLSSDL